jgi:hypothetical protein
MGTGRVNVPSGPGTPKFPPDQRQSLNCQGKVSVHPQGGKPWEENIIGVAALEGYKEE